jgi:mono/diheme cytochrome c family protein
MRTFPFILTLSLLAGSAGANEVAVAPTTDSSALAPLGAGWREENPYRGDAVAIAVGRRLFNESCARCHGVDAENRGAHALPAPDLRRLDGYCRRIADAALRATCVRDTDAYFVLSVEDGKIIVGIVHMPPWRDVLSQEQVWALRSFIESP